MLLSSTKILARYVNRSISDASISFSVLNLFLTHYIRYESQIIISFLEQEIQTTLREEIKSACEYRPFEKCDYSARIANEICCKKLEYVIEKMDAMQLNIEQSTNEV
jgi:hypothetical protein